MRSAPRAAARSTAPRAFRLTSEGAVWAGAAVLLGGMGWWKSLFPLLLLGVAMAVLFAVNVVLARRQARAATAERLPHRPVYAGESARVRVRVRNTGRRAATLGVTDGVGGAWFVADLPAGGETECSVRRAFPRRGRVGATPRVRSGFPFGLVRFERPGDPGGQDVLPATGRADAGGLRRWLARQTGDDGAARRVVRRAAADATDVRGVRPYRPGDSIRWVHWRSSARQGKLMVREYDAAPAPGLFLVVEPYLPATPTAADREALEAALSLATTVVRTWCRHVDAPLAVVVAGVDSVARTNTPSSDFARAALAPLATVEGADAFPPIAAAALGPAVGRSARVVVSSRPDSPLAAALSRATGRAFAAVDPAARVPWYTPPAAA